MDSAGRDGAFGSASVVNQLWYACAGFVYVPKIGDQTIFFPQGQLEQIALFQQEGFNMGGIPAVHQLLPSKIPCQVINVSLKAEMNTDEVFALAALIPLHEQQEYILEENHPVDNPSETYSFSKMLSPMETSPHAAGLYIPNQDADRCFPSLNMTLNPPMQDLVAKDLHGTEWKFRHIYCDYQRAHMLTTGWSTFVNSKQLVAGDSIIFTRGENGEIGIGIRRAIRQPNHLDTTSPLATVMVASHAVLTGTMFHVQYYPRNSPFEYMIPLRTYFESIERDYSIGTRVRMLSEVEGGGRRYGTIVGNEDFDPINWPGSAWRCIKVQWDSSTQIESVCPWWIETLGSSKIKGFPNLPSSNEVGSSSKPEDHIVDMDVDCQHYNPRNDGKSMFFIFGFFIFLCFFTFCIFFSHPLF